MDSSNLLALSGFLFFILFEISYKISVWVFFCIALGLDFVNKEGQVVPAPPKYCKLMYVMSFFWLGVSIIGLPGFCYDGYSSLGDLFCEDGGHIGRIIVFIIIEGIILFGVMCNGRTILNMLTGKMQSVIFYRCYKISLSIYAPAVVLCLKSFAQMIGFNIMLSVLLIGYSKYTMTIWCIGWIVYGTMLLIEPFLFFAKHLYVFKNDLIIYSIFRKGSYLSKSDVKFRHETEATYSLWVKGERKGQMPIMPQNLQMYRDLNLLEPNQEKDLSEG